MKKKISILLAVMLLAGCLARASARAGSDYNTYTAGEAGQIYTAFKDLEYMIEGVFCSDEAVGYWSMIHENSKNVIYSNSIDIASKIIGQYPDKKTYTEILANLMAMQEGDLAEQITQQSRFDHLKSSVDYAMDVVGLATTFFGSVDNEDVKFITSIVSDIAGGGDMIIKSLDQARYFEASIQDYSSKKAFLTAIIHYADNKDLKDAASSLLALNSTLLEKRLEYIADTGEMLAEYEADFFIDNLYMDVIKDTELYQTDETVKWYVDCSEDLISSIKSVLALGTFTFRGIMLAGDIGFGTSDTYNRYQEMKVVAEIADALVEANSKIYVSSDAGQEARLGNIQSKCDLYRMLLVTHARGEYLVYQLLISDAGILSQVRVLFDMFKEPSETTDSWYDGQINTLIEYANKLDTIFITDASRDTVYAGSPATVSVGSSHTTVGLKSDGTVIAAGSNYFGQLEIGDWTDITAVSASGAHTIGLKSDGTVIAAGYNEDGRCDVRDWTDMVAVSAGGVITVGLKADGTVAAVGDNLFGQCDVGGWTDIAAVSAGDYHTVGLKTDGTVEITGNSDSRQVILGWTDIAAISAGGGDTVGLKTDGTVVADISNNTLQIDVSDWTDMVAVAAGGVGHIVGLRSDGTVAAVGSNLYGECDVDNWTDIVAIAADSQVTVGLKSDGTVLAIGNNIEGQCETGNWTDIMVIYENEN